MPPKQAIPTRQVIQPERLENVVQPAWARASLALTTDDETATALVRLCIETPRIAVPENPQIGTATYKGRTRAYGIRYVHGENACC